MTTQDRQAALQSRRYQGIADLSALIAFASACTAQRSPLRSSWHPGDIIWALQTRADQPQPCRFWSGPDGVEALAWFQGENEVWIETLPASEHLVHSAVHWAEDAWRRRIASQGRPAERRLQIRAQAADLRRITMLEELGYRKAELDSVCFGRDLNGHIQPPELPPGYVLRDSIGVDPVLRAAAHRGAWDHLEHLGISALSQFSAEAYLSLIALPVYDPSLDILAVAPDGSLIANCICWADEASGVGVFEPVGVAPVHRGRRLAGAVMLEALARLGARGLIEARVGTAHFNHAAIAAYRAAGFEQVDLSHWWAKAIDT
ncbi:GNAT family N-acetyltransferase [Phenylobacterium sp.]|uniref:GNAT family N-acetyltransferase n=1 Tax=Phenylobacterium sp. TaxID=1871053 RepID=UPI002FDC98A7